MIRHIWIFALLLGGSSHAGLREDVAQARDHLNAGRHREARAGFLGVLAAHGAQLSGDVRARLALGAARASDAAGAERLLDYASKQDPSEATRARIAAVRLELAPGPAAPAPALEVGPDGAVRFLRVTPDLEAEHGEMQTAYAVYRRSSGPEVHLCGMVHIGFQSYYDAVTEDLKHLEMVLLEGMRGRDAAEETLSQPFARGRQWRRDAPGGVVRMDPVSEKLVRQWRGVKLPMGSQEHADMSYGELEDVELKRFGTRSAVAYLVHGDLFDQLPGNLTPDTDLREWAHLLADKATRPSLLDALQQGVRALVTTPPPAEVVDHLILTARNDRVMQVLNTHLHRPPHHRIAVMYGAAHMPDIHQRLTTMGYRLADVHWNTVWRF